MGGSRLPLFGFGYGCQMLDVDGARSLILN